MFFQMSDPSYGSTNATAQCPTELGLDIIIAQMRGYPPSSSAGNTLVPATPGFYNGFPLQHGYDGISTPIEQIYHNQLPFQGQFPENPYQTLPVSPGPVVQPGWTLILAPPPDTLSSPTTNERAHPVRKGSA